MDFEKGEAESHSVFKRAQKCFRVQTVALSRPATLSSQKVSAYLHIDEANRVSALLTATLSFQPPPLTVNGPAVDYVTLCKLDHLQTLTD